jgi:hypothetical protein
MKRLLLVAFTLAASVSVAHAQVCPPEVEFCPEEDLGATFGDDGMINVRTPFQPTDPYVVILPPPTNSLWPNDPFLPPNPVIVRPGG